MPPARDISPTPLATSSRGDGGRRLVLLAIVLALVPMACGRGDDAHLRSVPEPATPVPEQPDPGEADSQPTASDHGPSTSSTMDAPIDQSRPEFFVTSHRMDGNRYASGRGSLPSVTPVDADLGGVAAWVIGVPRGDDAAWLVALDDGTLLTVETTGKGVRVSPAGSISPGTPPLAESDGEGVRPVIPADGESPFTHPVFLSDGTRVAIRSDGTVWLGAADGRQAGDVDALLDARLLVDERDRVLVLTGPTSRYPHGVLGDALEAESVTLIDGTTGTAETFEVHAGLVVEGIAPIWTDVDADGSREIVLTLSDNAEGARLAVFDESGRLLAESAPIGRGQRWRHQVAVAPLGPEGEIEVVDVRTPHIGGVVEFFRMVGDRLEIVASVDGFTSHVIGTANLDLALAADADGDGHVELVVPTQDRRALGGITRSGDGARIAWTVPLGGVLTSNLAAAELTGDRVAFAAGTSAGTLRIWPARP